MADTERLRGIIEIESQLQELNQLLGKLTEIETAIQAVDGSTVRVDFETRGFEQSMAEMMALRGGGVGDVSVGGGRDVSPRLGGAGGINVPDLNVGGLGRQASDAARTVGQFGRSTGAVSETLDDAGETVDTLVQRFLDLDVRMSDMHNALARIIPLILVVIGALPALIGGLAGLAAAALAATAALFGIAGFGALGFAMQRDGNIMEGFTDILEEIQSDFLDAFTPLAQQLAPLFEDALDGLDMFFQALADNGDALLAFEQTARNFGAFLIREFPDFIAFLADVARAFEPVFSAIADALFGSNLGQGFMNFMADVMPALQDFGALLVAMLPEILQMSIGFLRVTNALMLLFNAFLQVITVGGMFAEEAGFLIGVLLSLATATFLWSSSLVQAAVSGLVALMKNVVTAIGVLLGYESSTIAAAISTHTFAFSLLTLIGIVTFGIGAMATLSATIGAIGGKFQSLTGNVNTAADSIRNFDRTTSRMDGARVGAYSPSSTVARGSQRGQSVSQSITIEGDADKDTVAQEQRNGLFRLNRTS